VRRKTGFLLLLFLLVPLTGLLAIWSGPTYEAPPSEDTRPPLLIRAIEATGGSDALGNLRSVHSRAVGHEAGRKLEIEITIRLPDQYRHDVKTGGAHFVHASDGTDAWSTLDGVRIPLETEDLHHLEEQMMVVRCSLLVDLEDAPDIQTKELGLRDQLEWLEVTFLRRGSDSFLMGFDRTTSLLTRLEWFTHMEGRMGKVHMTVDFSDHRPVQGIMVAFSAKISVDRKGFAEDAIQDIRFNGDVDPDQFRPPAPPKEVPILCRRSDDLRALVLNDVPGDPRDAERVLRGFLKEFDLNRNGPAFRLIAEGETTTVGIPVDLPAKDHPDNPDDPRTPHISILPAQDILTTISKEADAKTIREVELRLLGECHRLSLRPGGQIRVVYWKDAVVQVQLPFEKP
jgi:hypothetical protein